MEGPSARTGGTCLVLVDAPSALRLVVEIGPLKSLNADPVDFHPRQSCDKVPLIRLQIKMAPSQAPALERNGYHRLF